MSRAVLINADRPPSRVAAPDPHAALPLTSALPPDFRAMSISAFAFRFQRPIQFDAAGRWRNERGRKPGAPLLAPPVNCGDASQAAFCDTAVENERISGEQKGGAAAFGRGRGAAFAIKNSEHEVRVASCRDPTE